MSQGLSFPEPSRSGNFDDTVMKVAKDVGDRIFQRKRISGCVGDKSRSHSGTRGLHRSSPEGRVAFPIEDWQLFVKAQTEATFILPSRRWIFKIIQGGNRQHPKKC